MEIWKYVLELNNIQNIEMPQDAKILCLQTQFFIPCVWALVDPKAEKEIRTFETFGTGHELNDNYKGKYIGTYQQREGCLIFHVFLTNN